MVGGVQVLCLAYWFLKFGISRFVVFEIWRFEYGNSRLGVSRTGFRGSGLCGTQFSRLFYVLKALLDERCKKEVIDRFDLQSMFCAERKL